MHTHTKGLTRREVLQGGYSGALGLGLPSLLRQRASAADSESGVQRQESGKKMILVWTTGAMSHHDTLDMKPAAPAEIRGQFNPIQTKIPGYLMCELMPELSKISD